MQQLIFIAEQLETICSNIFDLLNLEGYQVILLDNSSFALRLVQELKPDLIFCDLSTPHVNGLSLLKALREDWTTAKIPFIFLMSETDSESRYQAMQLEANDYLNKPLNLKQLKQSIAHQGHLLR